ncbi:hypothetical protein QBC34DRAFT_215019 [Podospora aff. communis PSN243]|uniref:Uncharacterized protein n=1 Tax=Podospora aff. communis PSN243 TaxID=3040156 RepID=A0AAV9GXR7_9PEZI|nr:hypothetical protein QBC34DRAFT_215019 [Podospora aff. communis PSN243]
MKSPTSRSRPETLSEVEMVDQRSLKLAQRLHFRNWRCNLAKGQRSKESILSAQASCRRPSTPHALTWLLSVCVMLQPDDPSPLARFRRLEGHSGRSTEKVSSQSASESKKKRLKAAKKTFFSANQSRRCRLARQRRCFLLPFGPNRTGLDFSKTPHPTQRAPTTGRITEFWKHDAAECARLFSDPRNRIRSAPQQRRSSTRHMIDDVLGVAGQFIGAKTPARYGIGVMFLQPSITSHSVGTRKEKYHNSLSLRRITDGCLGAYHQFSSHRRCTLQCHTSIAVQTIPKPANVLQVCLSHSGHGFRFFSQPYSRTGYR